MSFCASTANSIGSCWSTSLTKPEEGVYAEGMMIVVGEQGEIDVSGRSLGPVYANDKEARKKELIAEIISHFSL